MKTLYFDCFSGISGDMTIGALLDLGLSRKRLENELKKLGLSKEYHLHISKKQQQQVTGIKFDVHSRHDHGVIHSENHHAHHDHSHSHPEPRVFDRKEHIHGRTFREIVQRINRSKLSSWTREASVEIFRRIAVAEGRIHGVKIDQVHFHEVGAIDSIVDIVGTCILMEELGVKQVFSSVPHEGYGFVECAHGRFPVPTTATLEILKGIPFQQIEIKGELITPTGAAILSFFASEFGFMPQMKVEKIGYGLGTRIYPQHPNVLRLILGEANSLEKNRAESEEVDVVETQVDDIPSEIIASAMGKLLEAGALDVFLTSVLMKKGRPGTLITVLCDLKRTGFLCDLLLQETGTLGLRIHRSRRICLVREIIKVKTKMGPLELKVGYRDGKLVSAKPEFESCLRLAQKIKIPVRKVWGTGISECARILKRI